MTDQKNWATPPVDVYENEDEYLLVTDLPGVKADDLVVQLEKGELLLEGSRDGFGYRRRFALPAGISGDAVTAELKDGVLNVRLAKPAEAKPKRIEVNAR